MPARLTAGAAASECCGSTSLKSYPIAANKQTATVTSANNAAAIQREPAASVVPASATANAPAAAAAILLSQTALEGDANCAVASAQAVEKQLMKQRQCNLTIGCPDGLGANSEGISRCPQLTGSSSDDAGHCRISDGGNEAAKRTATDGAASVTDDVYNRVEEEESPTCRAPPSSPAALQRGGGPLGSPEDAELDSRLTETASPTWQTTTATDARTAGLGERSTSVDVRKRRLTSIAESEEDDEGQPRETDEELKDLEDEGNDNSEEATAARVAEEYSNWKVNCRVLYDLVLSHTLEWPSLTVQWLPGLVEGHVGDAGCVRQKLLLGTHTSGSEENFLLVVEATLPASPIESAASRIFADREGADYEGFIYGNSQCKFKTLKRFPHPGEVNCARYMPQNPSVVATTAIDGSVLLYDTSLTSASATGPLKRLTGHAEEGFGLAWNTKHEGLLASASNGGTICLHDLQQFSSGATAVAGDSAKASEGQCTVSPLQLFRLPSSAAINDCCWLSSHRQLLLCCSDDGNLYIFDTRDGASASPPVLTLNSTIAAAKEQEGLRLTCCCVEALGEEDQHHFFCGDSEGTIRVFDWRAGGQAMHAIEKAHRDEITRIGCCSSQQSLIFSASRDRFISVFDLKKVGEEQSADDAEDGPPELVFTHGGHIAAVSDACWNNEDIASLDKVIASVGEDNKLQIWQLKRSVFLEDDEDEEVQESEGDDVE